MTRALIMTVLSIPGALLAATPTPQDFAHGLRVQAQANKPLQELSLPDDVYAQVTRADLGDLRVFNADGVVVAHALCPPATAAKQPIRRRKLPIFVLRTARADAASGAHVKIETSQGTRIRVLEPIGDGTGPSNEATTVEGEVAAYAIDARGLVGTLRAIRPQWRSAGGESEVTVRVQASDDLRDWRTIVDRTTLLQAEGTSGALQRNRIALPEGDYKYLRLERSAGGSPPRIEQVSAELQQPAGEVEPVVVAGEVNGETADEGVFLFDSQRLAPMVTAKVHLPVENMSLVVALDSRSTPHARWRRRWRGEVYALAGQDQPQDWTPIRFTATTDRYWRVRVTQGVDSLAGQPLGLSLGYHPRRLRFLAQGDGPFLLAYASARVTTATQRCERLLGSLSKQRRSSMTGAAKLTKARLGLGGAQALSVPPKPTAVRLYLLWGVLVVGALILIGLALSLLRRVRQD